MQPLSAPPRPRHDARRYATPRHAPPKQRAERRDPAPSRLAYRWHRMLLTPIYRKLLRVGLPAFIAAMLFGITFGDADRRAATVAWAEGIREQIASRPEFRVTSLAVTGASPETEAAIAATLGHTFPISSLGLDMEADRQKVAALDAVAQAQIRVRSDGALEVAITERLPVVVWRHGDGLELLDEKGHRVTRLESRMSRPDLPLIAGEGADRNIAGAMELMAAAEPLRDRVRGLVRMGERRWDLVLDRGQRIQLPSTGAREALERVIALDQAERLLDRDVEIVDMRLGRRPTLRLAPAAMAARLGIDGAKVAKASGVVH